MRIPTLVVLLVIFFYPFTSMAQGNKGSKQKDIHSAYSLKRKKIIKKAGKGTKKRTPELDRRAIFMGGYTRKQEVPFTKDIAGHPLRTRRYHPKKSKYMVEKPPKNYNANPNKGKGITWSTSWYDYWNRARIRKSAHQKEQPWKGDITQRPLYKRESSLSQGLQKPISSAKWLLLSGSIQGHQKKFISRSSLRKHIRLPLLFTGTIRIRTGENRYKTSSIRAARWDSNRVPIGIRIYKKTNSIRVARWDSNRVPIGIRIYKKTNSVSATRWDSNRVPIGIKVYKKTNSVSATQWDSNRVPIGIKRPKLNTDWFFFEGKTRVRKFNIRGLHPDAQFAHGFLKNTKGNYTFITNFKLFWQKSFNKNGIVPPALKKTGKKPHYDKGEKDLWFR